MSDIKPKTPSIPQWQRPAASSTVNSSSTPSSNSDETPRSVLLEQATKFLQDDSIRDASIDRKISFLESKGLRSEEIDSLLGVSRNAEASPGSGNTEGDKSTPDSTTLASRSTGSQSPQGSSPSSSPSTTPSTTKTTPHNVPPIITYPEFLVQQSKPPPLVTLRSILYTLYGAAGLGATLYGASEFLVNPMLASLTSARLELAQTTKDNLKKLNEKLEQNVSRIPPEKTLPVESTTEEDTESITSDPTELFHRDVATQTSQDLTLPSSPLPSASAEKPADGTAAPDSVTTVTTHLKRLETITSNLRDFASAEKESDSLDDSVRTRLNELHHYLDGLLYSRSSYTPVTGYGMYSTPGVESTAPSAGISKAEEDAISSFRSEIRGVKGALLSARNFPTSRGKVATAGVSGR